jgi:heat shock protein HtpX
VSDDRERVLVYDRIEANRRKTRLLLGTVALILLPVASGATVWLMPLLMIPLMILVGSSPGLQQSIQQSSPADLVALEGGLLALSLGLVTLFIALATTFLIHRYASALVLRAAGARPVEREAELDLHRSVENLCIGMGLPRPRLYLIESESANAFATGRDPEHAAVAVTRGLLTLLDRRELEGALAHELSHIGNHDVRLATTLAGLIGALSLPGRLFAALLRHRVLAILALFVGAQVGIGLAAAAWVLLSGALAEFPPFIRWWSLHAISAPFYVVVLAPLLGRLVRRAVSREREFLADADAVLVTRNPGALALALVKASSATGAPLRAGAATAHLYFVDPVRGEGPWIAQPFRSHPPVEERLDLLARMGGDVPQRRPAQARQLGTAAAGLMEA